MLEILRVVYDYGWAGLVILGAVILLYKMIVSRFSRSARNEEDSIFGEEEVAQLPLDKHLFFTNTKYRLNTEIKILAFDNLTNKPVRLKMYRDVLYLRVKTILEYAEALIQDYDDSKVYNAVELQHQFNESLVSFEVQCTERGIPTPVIHSTLKWMQEKNKHLIQGMSDVSNLQLQHKSMSVFLMLLNLYVVTLVADATKEFSHVLNGQFTGTLYNGAALE